MAQERVRKQSKAREGSLEQQIAAEVKQRTKEQQEAIDKSTDLLDEIDEILEQDAQEFVEGFRQLGGE